MSDAGLVQVDADGLAQVDAADGVAIVFLSGTEGCCCDETEEDCNEAFYCADDSNAGSPEAVGTMNTTKAYLNASNLCVYFTADVVTAVATGGSYTEYAGCAECVVAGPEVCESCTPGYHASLPPNITTQTLGPLTGSYNLPPCTINKNGANNCGYTGGGTWSNGAGGSDIATITVTYSSATCKYTCVVTKAGFGGSCGGSATYLHDAFLDPTADQGPKGDYVLVSTTGTCTGWPLAFAMS